MYILDTNICIHVLRRSDTSSDKLRRKFKAIRGLSISSITYAELCFGIAKGARTRRAERKSQLQSLVSRLHLLTWDSAAAEHYGEIRALLHSLGTPIGNNDLLIAAHARSLGAVLVSNNTREFSRVPDLSLEDWLAD